MRLAGISACATCHSVCSLFHCTAVSRCASVFVPLASPCNFFCPARFCTMAPCKLRQMIARLGGVPLTLCFLFWHGVEDAFLMDCASHALDKWLTRLVLNWAVRVLGWTGAAPASGLDKQCRSLGVPTWAWEIDLVLCWTVVALNRWICCCCSMHVKLAWLYELVPTGHSALATHGKRAEGIKQMEKKSR